MALYNLHCGVDIGGSHIAVGLLDGEGNMLLVVDHQLLNNSTIKVDDIVGIIYDLITQATYTLIDGARTGEDGKSFNCNRVNRIATVGIGCPGQCKDGVLIVSSNLPLLTHAPLASKLSALLEGIPVTLVNDADAAIAAEVWSKDTSIEYRSCQNVCMITLGTGIGLGLVLNRKLYHGSNGLIEGGHMIIAPPEQAQASLSDDTDRPCGCGQINCVECFASASSVTKRYIEAKQLLDPSSAPSSNSHHINAKFVFHQAAHGDDDAERIINDAAKSLAIMVINLCRIVDPEVIIFGGGMAQAGEGLLHRVRAHVKALSWKILPTDVKICLAKSMTEAGILGAAMAGKHSREAKEKQREFEERTPVTAISIGAVALVALAALAAFALNRRGL